MPTRIYPVRPLGRRYGYGAPQQQNLGGAFKAGGSFASEIIGGIGKAMAQRKAQQQQDQINAYANTLENTVSPPRAGLVSAGVNPVTGQGNVVGANVPTAGTAPFSTGQAGMKLQQDFIRGQLENQKLAQEVRNQGIASSMAARRGGGGDGDGGAGNASRWQQYLGGNQPGQTGKTGKAGKPAAYQANSSTPDQPDYYNFDHQRMDVDSQYGSKGTFNRLLAGSSSLGDPDPKTGERTTPDGSMTVDKNGNVTLAPKGAFAGAYIPAEEAQKNMARYDATTVQKGSTPRFTDQYLKSQHPEAGLPGGDPANPYTPTNILELNAVSPGKWFVNPQDGKVNQKAPPGQTPAQQLPAQKTSQVDTGAPGQGLAGAGLAGAQMGWGDQGQGLAGAQDYTAGGPQTLPQLSPVTPQAPVDLASVSPSNAPGSFDLGQPSSGGLPADLQLGDEIKRTQLANSLQGVA